MIEVITLLMVFVFACIFFAYIFYDMGVSKSENRYIDLQLKYTCMLIDYREVERKLEEMHG